MSSPLDRPLWPNQARGIAGAFAAEAEGARSICVTAPTGGGKRTMILCMVRDTLEAGMRAAIFTNRRVITRQTQADAREAGLRFGMVAAGYPDDLGEACKICSLQTVVRRRGNYFLPPADRVFIDEGHGKGFHWLIPEYLERGATVFLFTATPVSLNGICERLVVAGTNSELLKQGALVPCHTFSPEMPGIKGVSRYKVGQGYSKRFKRWFNEYQTDIFANVFEEWQSLNPFGLPTLLFAPGREESRWFVREFGAVGVKAAHMDGSTPEGDRLEIEEGSRSGEIKIVSSCGVLREGLDWPWIVHGIGCQAWVELSTYLQCVGRIMRAAPGKDQCILQDHSGSYWRHGSPNEDRHWQLGDTDLSLAKKRFAGFRSGGTPEPIRCPKCKGERKLGPKCPHCGYEHVKGVRMVRMLDGSLKRVQGNLTKKRRQESADQKTWNTCIWAAVNARGDKTLRQVAGDFYRRTGQRAPAGLRLMPEAGSLDWDRNIREVYPKLGKNQNARAAT